MPPKLSSKSTAKIPGKQVVKLEGAFQGLAVPKKGFHQAHNVMKDLCKTLKDVDAKDKSSTAGPYDVVTVTKEEWGARLPQGEFKRLTAPAIYVVLHHGHVQASPSGRTDTKESCCAVMRQYQDHQMGVKGWADLGFNFCVGEDGNVYEACGWSAQGTHAKCYDPRGIGICVLGNFSRRPPNDKAQAGARRIIEAGVALGHIAKDYTLISHQDVAYGPTDCPGNAFHSLIKTWPRYKVGSKDPPLIATGEWTKEQ